VEPVNLRRQTVYKIRTLIGSQKLPREHVMTFIDTDRHNGNLIFNARPFAGTQELRWDDIVSIDVIRHNARGRDSDLHYMNKVVRETWPASLRT
jgi:hypothetical protein